MRIETRGALPLTSSTVPPVTSGQDPFQQELDTDISLGERQAVWSSFEYPDRNENPGTNLDQALSVNPQDPQIATSLTPVLRVSEASASQAALYALIDSFD